MKGMDPVVNAPAPVPPWAGASVPLEMFDAFVVSVVALAAKGTPFVFVQVMLGIDTEQSPPIVKPANLPRLLYWIWPLVPPGVPPPPPPVVQETSPVGEDVSTCVTPADPGLICAGAIEEPCVGVQGNAPSMRVNPTGVAETGTVQY